MFRWLASFYEPQRIRSAPQPEFEKVLFESHNKAAATALILLCLTCLRRILDRVLRVYLLSHTGGGAEYESKTESVAAAATESACDVHGKSTGDPLLFLRKFMIPRKEVVAVAWVGLVLDGVFGGGMNRFVARTA